MTNNLEGPQNSLSSPLNSWHRVLILANFFPRRADPVCLPPQVAVLVSAVLQLVSTCTAPELPTAPPEEAPPHPKASFPQNSPSYTNTYVFRFHFENYWRLRDYSGSAASKIHLNGRLLFNEILNWERCLFFFLQNTPWFRSALLWDITQHGIVILYRHCWTAYRSHPQGQRSTETSIRIYHSTLSNTPEESRSL